MSYSVILPTLNEAGHIAELTIKIAEILLRTGEKYEILIIDDDSSDMTPKICKDLEKKIKNVFFFSRKNLKKNLAESINLGINKSKYENIIWLDADFQHPPEYIKDFHIHKKEYDIIIFSRFLKSSKRYFENSKFKKESNEGQSVFFNKICNFFFYRDITDYTSGFICIKKKIFNNYKLKGYYGEYFLSLIIHCKKKKYSIIELPYNEGKRLTGKSKTYAGFTIKYMILLYKYFICFFKSFIKKYFI